MPTLIPFLAIARLLPWRPFQRTASSDVGEHEGYSPRYVSVLQRQQSRPQAALLRVSLVYRFEYCPRRRALCRPTFLRSTSRASRVTSPAFLSAGFNEASCWIRARVMACRTAPAWPDSPPPSTLTRMSKLETVLVNTSGWRTIMRPVSREKNSSTGLPLTMMSPLPGLMYTRAVADLRRPVP